jgi:hypothetical protein
MILMPLAPPETPIHVIVDHVATTSGLPIWATTMISAGVGAVFGMVSGTLMEFFKAWNNHRSEKRTVKLLLTNEIKDNLNRIEELIQIVVRYRDVHKIPDDFEIELTVRALSDDLYSESIEKHRAVVYEIDHDRAIKRFAVRVRTLSKLNKDDLVNEAQCKRLSTLAVRTYRTGRMILNGMRVRYTPWTTTKENDPWFSKEYNSLDEGTEVEESDEKA